MYELVSFHVVYVTRVSLLYFSLSKVSVRIHTDGKKAADVIIILRCKHVEFHSLFFQIFCLRLSSFFFELFL